MKLIHTADVHLDSPLAGVANSAQRRRELLASLVRLNDYANANGVTAIIVAGDLFDEKFTTDQTVRSVADVVNSSGASWFVLRGNHGGREPYDKLANLCPIHFFEDGWTKYTLDGVTICGRELGTSDLEQWQKLTLDKSAYNVLVLHGDVDDPSYGLIDRKAIAASNANYVALGHRHACAEHRFGAVRGCYSGVLEARGFDETAPTGFVVIDTDRDEIKFIPQAIRQVVSVTVDVSDVTSDVALQGKIRSAIEQVDTRNYLNLVLTGDAREDMRVADVAHELLDGRFFALRVSDKTALSVDLEKIAQEVSLRGEFVKLASGIEDERLRQAVLKMGLAYLNGEVKA